MTPTSAATTTATEKTTAEAAEATYDRQNAKLAVDPAKRRAITRAKAADDARHRAELAATQTDSAPWPTGIFEDSEAPASGMDFLGSNRWVGQVGDGYLAVYAGTAGDDNPTTGRVMALWSDGRTGYTLDLPGAGPLRIVSADGSTLTIIDSTGETHVLDAESGSWLP